MSTHLLFLILGLGAGAATAALGMALVLNQKGTGVLNFAVAGIALWGAFTFDELRTEGDLVLPLVVVPNRIHIGQVPTAAAIVVAIVVAAALGWLVQRTVVQRLRSQAPLAGIVASVGLLLTFQTLIPLRFGTSARRVEPILPASSIEIAGQPVPVDRLLIAGVVIIAALVIAALLFHTRHGLALRASGDDETAVALAGWSPSALALASAASASALACLVLILSAPAVGLNPSASAALLVPALAVALAGRLDSILVAAACGLALGAIQSELTYASSMSWWPSWGIAGISDAVPFLVIVLLLVFLGGRIPSRSTLLPQRLPPFLRPSPSRVPMLACLVLAVVLVVVTDGSLRFGLITSLIISLASMSFVVATGMLGQPSFGQAAIAGLAGFTLSKLATEAGLAFPWAALLSILAGTLAGVILGLPALRVRGIQLAVVTLAAAVAVEQLVLRNPRWTSQSGNLIPNPELFGLNLGIRDATHITRVQFGLFVVVIVGAAAVFVRRLALSLTGLRFLAVRTDERAAASIGIDVTRTKLLGFAAASLLAATSGVLLGYSRGQLSADSFTVLIGISWLAFAYLGGITSLAGAAIAGTMAPLGIAYVLANRLVDTGDWYLLAGAIGLTLTAIMNPHGIAGTLPRRPPRRTSTPTFHRAAQPLTGDRRTLEVEGLSVQFGGVAAVQDLSFVVHPGKVSGLIGPNGAGKTSAVDAITGFVPSSGVVRLGDVRLDGVAPHARARAGLARTWQSGQLFDELTVREHLELASRSTRTGRRSERVSPGQVDETLRLLHIDQLADRKPPELSLGQRKLVGVARAIAAQPYVLLLDEPAAGLDRHESAGLAAAMREIAALGHGVLVIDHDMSLIHEVCDDLYVMEGGCLLASGAVENVVAQPLVVEAYLGTPASDAAAR